MRCVAADPYIAAARFRRFRARRVTHERLFELADVVTVHTPLTLETRGMIGAREIARMRPGAWIVNCARGGIVDEAALLAALREGRLTGAAIDTWMSEPGGNPALLAHPAVIGTPHVGAATRQAKQRLVTYMARAVSRFLARRVADGRLR
jgi:D-3-phosphoglycerate dehydrogenase